MIIKYRFGVLAAPVEVVDSMGNAVPNAGIAFELTAGAEGLTITHIHMKAVRRNVVPSANPLTVYPETVT